MLHLRTVVAVSLVMLALICAPSSAAAVTVTNLNDSGAGSLRDALALTPPGGTIDFAPGLTGSIPLLSTLTIAQSVTIQGPGVASLTIDGQDTVRVIDITGGTVTLRGVTIANGNIAGLGGGIQVGGGVTLTVSQCVFFSNNASNGGAISVAAAAVLAVDECTFTDNTTTGVGGGALITFGDTTVTNSTFTGNTAPINGGAINVQPAGTLILINSTLFDNSSGALGGALANLGTTTIINSTLAGNQGSSGSALASGNNNVTIYNSVFADNAATAAPGALSPDGAGFTTSNNVFFNNTVNGVPDDQTGYNTSNFFVATAQPLAPLGDYGGPTLTMLPVPGGEAICAGSVALVPDGLTRDQRGFPRISVGRRPGGDQATLDPRELCVDAGADQTVQQAIPILSMPVFVLLLGGLALFGFRRLRRVTS